MNTLIVLGSACLSGLLLGRLADLMFRDLRAGLPWLFGPIDDCYEDQVRLLTFSSAATMAAAIFALNNGVSVIAPVLVTPFLFNWVAAFLLLAHRAVGPTFENAVIRLHPVDIGYGLVKTIMTSMWSRGRSSLVARGNDVAEFDSLKRVEIIPPATTERV